MNAYQILKVAPTASREEIRSAYRALARRWHPDRFMEGPERDWANEKMAQINAAYHCCLKGKAQMASAQDDGSALQKIQQLIDDGLYRNAREMLMGITTRCAEWNYLFGAVLMKMCETEKALIYLSVAAHQRPDVAKYAQALRQAQAEQGIRGRIGSFIRRKAR